VQNKSQVYKSEYDVHVLSPQEKESLASLCLAWLQGKGTEFYLLKYKTFLKNT